jgi:hypothetical protein
MGKNDTASGQDPSPADQFRELGPLARMLVGVGLVPGLDLKKFDEVVEQIPTAKPNRAPKGRTG